MTKYHKFSINISLNVKNVDIDKILVNNIGNSGITRPVFNAIENKKFDEQ